MRKLTTIIITIFFSIPAFAQLEVKEGSFREVYGFVNINLDIQTDDNDIPYAVVKVKTENINDKQRRELIFQGDAATFIECEYKVGEVWVYLTYKASYLKISHPDLSSTEFWFPFDMEPKKGYELTLANVSRTTDDEVLKRLKQLEDAQQRQTIQQNDIVPEQAIEPSTNKTPKSIFVTLNGAVNNYGKTSLGFTVGSVRKAGFFLNFMTNFVFTNFGLENSKEHQDAEYIQTLIDTYGYKQQEHYVYMSVMGGLILNIYSSIYIKIGGGYSNNSLWIEVSDSDNTRNDYWVNDYSSYGFGGIIGLQAHWGRFVVSLDCATTNFKTYESRIGLGYMIGGY